MVVSQSQMLTQGGEGLVTCYRRIVLHSMGIACVIEAAQRFKAATENGAGYSTLGCCTLCSWDAFSETYHSQHDKRMLLP